MSKCVCHFGCLDLLLLLRAQQMQAEFDARAAALDALRAAVNDLQRTMGGAADESEDKPSDAGIARRIEQLNHVQTQYDNLVSECE